MEVEKKYLGFYLSRTFWAGDALPLNDVSILPDFHLLMSQIVFKHIDENFELLLCKDGMFLIRINRIEAKYDPTVAFADMIVRWSVYLLYANVISLLFDTAIIKKLNVGYFEASEITNKDAFSVRLDQNLNWKGHQIAQYSYASVLQHSRFPTMLEGGPSNLEFKSVFQGRPVIGQEAFDHFLELFKKVVLDNELIFLLNLLNKGLAEYKIGNFESSLLHSWLISEHIVPKLWESFIHQSGAKSNGGMSKKRIEALMDGNTYPMSAKLNILELSQVLPYHLFDLLNNMRRVRNDVVHQNKRSSISFQQSGEFLNGLNDLIELYRGFKLDPLNLGLSVKGI